MLWRMALAASLYFILLVGGSSPPQAASLSAPPAARLDELEIVFHFPGISSSPETVRADADETTPGDIWLANLEQGSREALTAGGEYRWPVFEPGGRSVLALTGDRLVRVAKGAKPELLHSLPGIVKLVGFEREDPDRLLLTRDQPDSPLAILALSSGKLTPVRYNSKDKDQRRILAHIRGEERVYGTSRVYVATQTSKGIEGTREWTDVFFQSGSGKEQNVSRCEAVNCGQPSLSGNGKTIVYVQSRK